MTITVKCPQHSNARLLFDRPTLWVFLVQLISGTIPESLGRLTNMETLDLVANQLTGESPRLIQLWPKRCSNPWTNNVGLTRHVTPGIKTRRTRSSTTLFFVAYMMSYFLIRKIQYISLIGAAYLWRSREKQYRVTFLRGGLYSSPRTRKYAWAIGSPPMPRMCRCMWAIVFSEAEDFRDCTQSLPPDTDEIVKLWSFPRNLTCALLVGNTR